MLEALLVPNCTSTFLARTGESRDMLGAAFCEVLYCHVRTVLQMITWQLPVMARLVKWGKETDPKCACGCIAETTAHVMLQCRNLHDAITA